MIDGIICRVSRIGLPYPRRIVMLRRLHRVRQQLCAPALILAMVALAPVLAHARRGWTAAVKPTSFSGDASLPPIDFVSMGDSGGPMGQPVITTDSPGGQYWISPQASGPPIDGGQLPMDNGEWISPHANGGMTF